MHPFTPRWPEDDPDFRPPAPWTRRFRSADDLISWAEFDFLLLTQTWPEVWHLDTEGVWRCYSRGSSFLGLPEYAGRPGRLLACRDRPTEDVCPDHWVIIEPRQADFHRPAEATEADAAAFLRLRNGLGRQGVWLLDVVVISDIGPRWWSLNELTTGTTAWEFPANPRARARRSRSRR